MKKVLIIGANGKTGTILTKKLKEHPDYVPVAMIRNEEQKSKFDEEGIETVIADLEGDISEAIKGKDFVVFAAGSGSKTGPDKTIAVDEKGAIRSIETAKKLDIEHYVMLSAMGTDRPQDFPALAHYLEAKKKADDVLESSGLSYSIIQPGRLTDDPATGMITAKEKLEEGGKITREDVAEVMLQSLELNTLRNKKIQILEGDDPMVEVLENF